jgi:hypothetical protein
VSNSAKDCVSSVFSSFPVVHNVIILKAEVLMHKFDIVYSVFYNILVVIIMCKFRFS